MTKSLHRKAASLLLLLFCFPPTFSLAKSSQPKDYADQPWETKDLKILDPWGDTPSECNDIIAVYEKQNTTAFHFRIDFLNLDADSSVHCTFLIDCLDGGNNDVMIDGHRISADIQWDYMISLSREQDLLFDSEYTDISDSLNTRWDTKLDFCEFSIKLDMTAENNSTSLNMQVMTLNPPTYRIMDKTAHFSEHDTTGRVKVVLSFMNAFIGYGPHAVSWYDGYALSYKDRQGERGGLKYLFDAVETYELPLTINDLRIEQLPGNEYLHINDRIKSLADKNLLDPLMTLNYGHFMCWQSNSVDSQAINLSVNLREQLDLPVSDVMYPYEAMIHFGDIDVIKHAGFKAIYGLDRYNYWFGPIEDWSNADIVKQKVESAKKIHEINGMLFFFQPVYGGFVWDPRWGELDWSIDLWAGTDDGLHIWFRRIFSDMAMDEDQEKYFTLGTDLNLTSWLYKNDVERDFAWIAAHPWIQVTTFADILKRNWTPVPHPEINLQPDDPLEQVQIENDGHYNAYFWQFYYGGISDGHSPFIPEGAFIESYFDYVPYVRDGEKIANDMKMGDENSAGTVIYETVQNLKSAPHNDLTTLAWLSYFNGIAEQTFHAQHFYDGDESGSDWGGQYLHPAAKFRANDVRQVNKLVAAANWVKDISEAGTGNDTQIRQRDLDLDGETEYLMYNDQVFLIFENDGGRIEYAFSADSQYGPIQHIAPVYQHMVTGDGWGWNYKDGEIATAPRWIRSADAGFVEDLDKDGQFDYPVYTVQITGDSLQFTAPDSRLTKIFELNGNQISSHYSLNQSEPVEIGVGLVLNLMHMFSPAWCDKFDIEHQTNRINLQIEGNGSAVIDFSDPNVSNISLDSFTDSPARTELMERDNYDGYPSGHWLFYPYHTLSFNGMEDFTLDLILSSRPLAANVNQRKSMIAQHLTVYKNYPNPFNSSTRIKLNIARRETVLISIYDLRGRKIATLAEKEFPSGLSVIEWDAKDSQGYDVSSGVYFIQIQSGDERIMDKAIVLK